MLTEFLKKHKNKKSPGLWSMSHRKAVVVKNLNDKINHGKYHFSERVSRIVDGRKMTFYKEWEDRFIDFCLYRYLMRLAFQKNLISPNYMSCRGRGRFHAVRCLFEQKKSSNIFLRQMLNPTFKVSTIRYWKISSTHLESQTLYTI